jgi:predicted permease
MRIGTMSVEALLRDLRHAARALRRQPGFATMAIATLALATGPNAAIFSLLDALLLRPLPVHEPERLVALNNTSPRRTFPIFSHPSYQDLKAVPAFAGLIAYRVVPVNLSRGEEVGQRTWGTLVSGDYFDVLGVGAFQGRLLGPGDDRERGGHPVVVVSHSSWQRRFGSDPGLVGSTLVANGRPYTVVGIAAPGFSGSETVAAPELWFPLSMQAQVEVGRDTLDDRGAESLFVQGRLAPGVDARTAQAALEAALPALAEAHPESYRDRRVLVSRAGLFGSFGAGTVTSFTGSLTFFAGLVLLLACTNLANLLLARGTARAGEVATLLALGASRGQLVRRLLAESLLLSAAGSALGVLLAAWLIGLANRAVPAVSFFPLALELHLDGRVLAFAAALTCVTTVLCGLVPALQSTRPGVQAALREGQAETGGRRARLRGALVGAQVALCTVLLVGGGLMLQAADRAQRVDLGFAPEGAGELSFDLRLQGYAEGAGREFQARLLKEVRALPGVAAAGLADIVPVDLHFSQVRVLRDDAAAQRPDGAPRALISRVSPGYVQALGTPLVAGRDFDARDAQGAPRVAVVNEAFGRELWPGQDPLGRRFRLGSAANPEFEVVGVLRDGKYARLDDPARPLVVLSLAQSYTGSVSLVVRGGGDTQRLLADAERALHAIDPRLPVASRKTLVERLAVPLLPTRLAAAVLASLGVLALGLAALGIYGVASYAVARRTREIGVRMAIGASPGDVVRLVLGDGLRTAGAGLAVGLGLALLAARLVQRFLFGVSAADVPTYAAVAAVLATVAVVGNGLPARRAAATDPATALRRD